MESLSTRHFFQLGALLLIILFATKSEVSAYPPPPGNPFSGSSLQFATPPALTQYSNAPSSSPFGGSPYGGAPYPSNHYGGSPFPNSPFGGGPQPGNPFGGGPQQGNPFGGGPQQGNPFGEPGRFPFNTAKSANPMGQPSASPFPSARMLYGNN